jgi:GNAT superfamily N-acetyltransferase
MRKAQSHERNLVHELVMRIHVEVSGYSPESTEAQIKDLPVDFPVLFDDFKWENSKCWLCFSRDIEDNGELSKADTTDTDTTTSDSSTSQNAHLLGCIGIQHARADTAELGYFFIEEKARGVGIGHELLQTAINWVKNNPTYPLCNPLSQKIESPDYQNIKLITLRHFMECAITLYEKFGFVIYEEAKIEYFDTVYMRLEL